MPPIPIVICNFFQNEHVFYRLWDNFVLAVPPNKISDGANGWHPHVVKCHDSSRRHQLIGQIEIHENILKPMISIDENELKSFLSLY